MKTETPSIARWATVPLTITRLAVLMGSDNTMVWGHQPVSRDAMVAFAYVVSAAYVPGSELRRESWIEQAEAAFNADFVASVRAYLSLEIAPWATLRPWAGYRPATWRAYLDSILYEAEQRLEFSKSKTLAMPLRELADALAAP